MTDIYYDIVYTYICKNNYLYVKQLLDDHSDEIDVNRIDEPYGNQLIHIACANNSLEIVQLLIDNGAVVESEGWYTPYEGAMDEIATPLSIAIHKENGPMVEAIIKAGLKKNINFVKEQTAFKHFNDYDIIKLLLDYGADINIRNKTNMTPLIHHCYNGYIMYQNIITLLVEGGANINAIDDDNISALMYACYSNRPNIVKLLIDAGADIDIRDDKGDTLEIIIQRIISGYDSDNEYQNTDKQKFEMILKFIQDERDRLMKEKHNARRLVILGKRTFDSDGIGIIGEGLLGMVASYVDPSGNRPKLKE